MASKSRGSRFRERVLAENTLNASEEIILDEVVRVLDTIDSLPPDAKQEVRLQQVLLSKLLGQLALPDDDGEPEVPTPATLRGRAAAKARWDRRDQEAKG